MDEKIENVNEAQNENVENQKDFSKNENNEYNNNKEEQKPKSLEDEVNEAKDRKYLAKTIVDLKEETAQTKQMLSEILSLLKASGKKSFTDSKINDSNSDESKYIIEI